jgi:hypothetical protein
MYLRLHHGGLRPATSIERVHSGAGSMNFASSREGQLARLQGSNYPIHLMSHDGLDQGEDLSRHIAIDVESLEEMRALLLDVEIECCQASLADQRVPILSRDQPLDFGIGPIFLWDPDGNSIEFLEQRRGISTLMNTDG